MHSLHLMVPVREVQACVPQGLVWTSMPVGTLAGRKTRENQPSALSLIRRSQICYVMDSTARLQRRLWLAERLGGDVEVIVGVDGDGEFD